VVDSLKIISSLAVHTVLQINLAGLPQFHQRMSYLRPVTDPAFLAHDPEPVKHSTIFNIVFCEVNKFQSASHAEMQTGDCQPKVRSLDSRRTLGGYGRDFPLVGCKKCNRHKRCRCRPEKDYFKT
jgi:hypothetical protein